MKNALKIPQVENKVINKLNLLIIIFNILAKTTTETTTPSTTLTTTSKLKYLIKKYKKNDFNTFEMLTKHIKYSDFYLPFLKQIITINILRNNKICRIRHYRKFIKNNDWSY